MMRKAIKTDKAAQPKGIYSQAIIAEGPQVFLSGQAAVDPETGEFKLGDFRQQVELTFQNIGAILEAAGTSWEHVIKMNVYLSDLNNFAEMNEIYKEHFKPPYPARTTCEVGLGDLAVEIDCVAIIPPDVSKE